MVAAQLAPPPDDVSLLVLLLDVNPFFWKSTQGGLTFRNFIEQVVVFLYSFLLLHHLNQVAVIANGVSGCQVLYHSPQVSPTNAAAVGTATSNGRSDGQAEAQSFGSVLVQRLLEVLSEGEKQAQTSDSEPQGQASMLSGALSMALCYVQRVLRGPKPQPQPRVLCLQGSPDASPQYIGTMNAIFSAQRSGVPIDVCMVGGQDSPFLQQAAHISGGAYMKPQRPEGFLQYLLMASAVDLHSRRFLQLPRPAGVDFRASCFCHKKTIDMGYVCSVCLSIFCQYSQECSTCGATFSMGKGSGQKRKK